MDELERTFDFSKKDGHDAIESLTRTRSREFKRNRVIRRHDLWNKPAPDLRMQLYHPQPLPRNSREAVQPERYKASFDLEPPPLSRAKTEIAMIPSLKEAIFGGKEKESEIVVSPRVLRPWEAQLLYVKEGMYPKGRYYNPKPHDYRQYPALKSLGLPEFKTSYEKDPYNIKFKSNNLDQVHGLPMSTRDILPGKQMGDSVLKQPPKWQRKLHLPHESYPNRAKQTTRYRPIYRSPHSAFLERVERKLTTEWNNQRTTLKTAPKPVTTMTEVH